MKGFISDDGNYGVFQYGKQYMVIYHNQQLDVFKTIAQCNKFIKKHQDTLQTEPPKQETIKRSPRVKAEAKPASIRKTAKKNNDFN